MELPLLSLLLSLTLVSAKLLHDDDRPREGELEERRKVLMRNQDRQHRSVSSHGNLSKVLDFSADNDHEPDSNGEYTSATLDAGFLPESWTICSAIMVDAWTTEFTSADMFQLLDDDGDKWGYIDLFAPTSYTEYEVKVGPVHFNKQIESVFFPLQWSVVTCLPLLGHNCRQSDTGGGRAAALGGGVQEGGG